MHFSRSFKNTSIAIAISQALMVGSVSAVTITVDDGLDGASGCSLRSAITSINTAQNSPGCSSVGEFGVNDVINFGVDSVSGLTSPLTITASVSINPGGDSVEITSLGNGSVFDIRDSIVSFDSLLISGGRANLDGGGIFMRDATLRLNDSTVSGNSAGDDGGGVFVRNSTLFLNNSRVTNNSAATDEIAGDDGGGIYARSSTVTLNNSTVLHNSANDEGAGIFTTASLITINNSTISGNHAGDEGGGVLLDFNSSVSITHSTVSNNTAERTGGGISLESGSLSLRNSLIAGNAAGTGATAVSELFVGAAGAFNFAGNNLLGESSDTTQDATNITPTSNVIFATSDSSRATSLDNILAPLADNGGQTLTHAIVEGSPAIDTASNLICASSGIRRRDQRGFVRVDRCDIGAVEFGAVPPVFNPAIIVPPTFLLLLDEEQT